MKIFLDQGRCVVANENGTGHCEHIDLAEIELALGSLVAILLQDAVVVQRLFHEDDFLAIQHLFVSLAREHPLEGKLASVCLNATPDFVVLRHRRSLRNTRTNAIKNIFTWETRHRAREWGHLLQMCEYEEDRKNKALIWKRGNNRYRNHTYIHDKFLHATNNW